MRQMPLDAVEGYRGFAVTRDRLVSPIAGKYEWHPGINTSRCRSCGDTPRRGCRCGFYSYTTEETAIEAWGEECFVIGRTVSGRPVSRGGMREGEFALAMVKNAGIIWKGSRGYRSQFAQVSALLTDQPDLYAGILERYDIIPVRPLARDDRGMCQGIIYGFASGSPGEVLVRVVGLTPQDGTADYRMDPASPAYTVVAVAGIGARVALTFELRHGKRWVTEIDVCP